MLTDDQLIGRVIDGTYEIVSVLGRGGMGVVYKARHAGLDTMRAIKILRSVDQTSRKRFQREANIIGHLDHPNIVKVHKMSVAESDGMIFLVMDYIDGESLSALLHREGALPIDKAIEIFVQICEALDCAANAGIVHRDLKPSNVMLTKQGKELNVKLLDFGLAKVLGGSAQGLTATDCLMGSPSYMSPEQCLSEPLDARSDIYSMGILMYQTLTGQLPFQADAPHLLLRMQVEDAPAAMSDLRPDVPDYLQRIVMKCMQKKPEDRFQTWADLQEAMVGKRRVTNKFSAHGKRKRNNIVVGALAVLALLLSTAALVAVMRIETRSAEVQTIEQARENLKRAQAIYKEEPDRAKSLLAENEKFLRPICLQFQSLPDGTLYDQERQKQGDDLRLYADTLGLEFEMSPYSTTLGAEAFRMYYASFERVAALSADQRKLCLESQLRVLKQAKDLSFAKNHTDWYSEIFLASYYPDCNELRVQTLELARTIGARSAQINCLIALARGAIGANDFAHAAKLLEQALTLRSHANDDQLSHLAQQALLCGLEPVALEICKSRLANKEGVDSWIYREYCKSLGRVYAQMGEWKLANKYFGEYSKRLHETEPITFASGALSELIDIDCRRGMSAKAKDLCEYEIKLCQQQKVFTHEAEAFAHLDYVMVGLRTNDLEKINQQSKAALESAAKSKDPHFVSIVCLRLASTHAALNDHAGVVEMLNQAMRNWPTTPNEIFQACHEVTKLHELAMWKAKTLLMMNKTDEGLAIVNKALPPSEYSHMYRELGRDAFYLAGKALFDKGKGKESQRFFQKSLEFNEALASRDSPSWFVTKANMLQAMHQYSESTANYKEAVSRLKPVDVATKAELLLHIGTNEEVQGKYDSAALIYDDSQKLFSKAFGPTSIQATGMLLNQARVQRQLGKLGEAERLLLQARESLTRTPVQKIMLGQCLSELAVVYEQLGDKTKKKQMLQEIAKLN